jgi:hypothetical protein
MSRGLALHIDRLRLTGFSPLDAQRVRDAFTATLAASDADKAALPAAQDRLRLTLPADSSGSPEAIGRAAARALLEGWRR